MEYIHQLKDWPRFTFDPGVLAEALGEVRLKQGRLIGRMESMGFELKDEAILQTLTSDVVKNAEIEGEKLELAQVRSSIARKLGMDKFAIEPENREVEGMVTIHMDATRHFNEPLTKERLCGWQAALFPTGYSDGRKIVVGQYRRDEMVVASGRMDKPIVYFEAVKPILVPAEMNTFLTWVNTRSSIDSVLKAGIAHLYFLTIHPFDDGNGRIARAITDYLLAKSEQSYQRFYSLSTEIHQHKPAYYRILEKAQKGSLDLTEWLSWYLELLDAALQNADNILEQVIFKAAFWQRFATTSINDRQRKVLGKMLDGFEGRMQRNRYGRMVGVAKDTAFRDLQDLVEKGMLKTKGTGRGTHYVLTGA